MVVVFWLPSGSSRGRGDEGVLSGLGLLKDNGGERIGWRGLRGGVSGGPVLLLLRSGSVRKHGEDEGR